jgi:predicted NAD/FAD-binding protein
VPQMYGLYSQTSIQTVANTTIETTIIGSGVGSLTVPALFFQNGYSFLYKTGGIFRDSSNGQTIRFRLRNGGVLFDSGVLVLSNVNYSSSQTLS